MLTRLLFHFCLQSNSVSWASLPHCSEENGKSHSAASYQGPLFLCTSLCLTVSPESETGFHILHPNPSTAPHTLVVFNQFLSKEKRNSPAAGSVSAMQGSTGSSLERLPRIGISVDFPVSVLRCFSCVRLYKTSWTACHFLLQEIFPAQGLNPRILHCRWILYHLNHQGQARVCA